MVTEAEVLVIGAGAAGVAAAQTLTEAGKRVIILEARHRVGGRAWTDNRFADFPVELGAEFVHGGHVITWDLLEKHGFKAVVTDAWDHMAADFNGTVYDELPADIEAWEYQLYEEAYEHVQRTQQDRPLSDVLQHLGATTRKIVNNLMNSDLGADLEHVGTYGIFEEADVPEGMDDDYHILKGYSALFDALAKGLDIRFGVAVESVKWSDATVQVTTRDNQTYTAPHCIVTVPLAILQSEMIAFSPALPSPKIKAIHGLGAGIVHKVILQFDKPVLPRKVRSLVTTGSSQLVWRGGVGHKITRRTVWTAIVTDKAAREHATMTDEQIIDSMLTDLAAFSKHKASDLKSVLKAGRVVRWSDDEFSQMGYSYVPVGGAGLREKLAQPLDNKLFFAGEATSTDHPATVHGAYESGIAAAKAILT